jgi:PBSX family phage portal protein
MRESFQEEIKMSDSTTSTLSPREELYSAIKAAQEERNSITGKFFSSRQYIKESSFTTELMVRNNLLVPPFEPERMYTLVESSGILPQCIDAMIQNIDGFGYDFKFNGTSETEDSEEALKELEDLRNFFDQVNEQESFRTVRIHLRKDIEVTGNGYIEVIRFMDGTIATIYHMDSKLVRLQAKQEEPYSYKIKMWRKGKHRPIPISRRFRRYAMKVSSTDSTALRWFKEYGDPRRMCAATGRYEEELKNGVKIKEEASEVIHFKIGTGAYGVPRWSGQIANALGMNSADYVNWDLFENQVVPPLAIMVSGGTLTAESVKDVRSILLEKKGVENFNKVLILEAQSEGNVTDKSATKIELKEMSAARKEDAMFVQYTDKGEHRIRSAFRLPPMMAGRTDCFDEETQTLTKNGWKFYWEVQENEKIATFNPETEAIEYHVPNSGLRLFDYEGPMYHFKNSVVDIKVSPEHDMWVSARNSQEWNKVAARDLFSQKGTRLFRVAPSSSTDIEWESFGMDGVMRRSGEQYPRSIPMDTLLRLIGYYVGDGSSTSRENRYSISLSAGKERKLVLFRQIAEELNKIDPYIITNECTKTDGMTKISISDIGIFEWLVETCGKYPQEKRLPGFYNRLSYRQSRILLEALINTDGSPSGQKKWKDNPGLPSACRYNTTSVELADQVQILGLRSGFRSNLSEYIDIRPNNDPTYMVSLKETTTVMFTPSKQIDEVYYKGKIYCFDVPNHLFVTRRKGKVSIQGNTYSKSTADSSKMVAEEQIFVPERSTFDEVINMTLMRDMNVKYWLYASKGPRLITGREIIDGFKEFSKAGIITINEGIRLANRVLNMDITKYPEPWADYPIPIVIELAKMGVLKDLDEISTITEELSTYIMERRNPIPADASTSDDNVDEEVTEEDPPEEDDDDVKAATEEEMILAYAQLSRLKTIIKSLKEKRLFEDKASE